MAADNRRGNADINIEAILRGGRPLCYLQGINRLTVRGFPAIGERYVDPVGNRADGLQAHFLPACLQRNVFRSLSAENRALLAYDRLIVIEVEFIRGISRQRHGILKFFKAAVRRLQPVVLIVIGPAVERTRKVYTVGV